MNTSIPTLNKFVAAAVMTLFLVACGGGGGGGSAATGSSGLALSITDAPVNSEDIFEVVVRFTKVTVRPEEGEDIVYFVTNPQDPSLNYIDIELTQLAEGVRVLLGEFVLKPGNYQWVRLDVDLTGTRTHVEEVDGAVYAMDCPSCAPEQSGLKLNRPFTIEEEGWVAWTIDFDLLKSLTMHPQYATTGKNKYKLRPTLRIIDTELASAFIYGTVTDNRSEATTPAPDACVVYVYEGSEDAVEPDDICFTLTTDDPPVEVECDPADSDPAGSGHRPILEAAVVGTPNDAGGTDYAYKTGFLYPDSLDPIAENDTDPLHDGTYTVALLCVVPADDRDVDEDFTYIGEAEVYAETPGGYPHPFDIVDTFELGLVKNGTFNDDLTADGIAQVGETITYTFAATNEGNTTLSNVAISDALLGGPVCDQTSLAPGASLDCDSNALGLDYVLIQADVDAGQVDNTATATSIETGEVSSNALSVVLPSGP